MDTGEDQSHLAHPGAHSSARGHKPQSHPIRGPDATLQRSRGGEES